LRRALPVVVIDSDLKSDKYVSFVATDNFKGGQMAGEEMGKQLGGKGNVILRVMAVGSPARKREKLDSWKRSKNFPRSK